MEPKSKFRPTPSCLVQGASGERTMIDRFSDVPDDIAHYILYFLRDCLRSLIQFGAVSKRCRHLHLSATGLNIDSRSVSNSRSSRAMLLNRCDRYLFHRGDNRFGNFNIYWTFNATDNARTRAEEYFRIATLIQNAVRCNVICLELLFTQNSLNTVVLPSCIFRCQTLMELEVNLSGGDIQSPSLYFLSNLEDLRLENARVKDDRFFQWISHACKRLVTLHLINVGGIKNITIESSSLQIFKFVWDSHKNELWNLKISSWKLEHLYIVWWHSHNNGPLLDQSPCIRSLNIFAPELKRLDWVGNFLNHQHLGNLKSLEYACIYLSPVLEQSNNFFEVLCSLRMVKTLFLIEETVKAFFVEGSMPLPLCNIQDLTLPVGSLEDDFIPALVYLFRGITTLNTLHIMSLDSDEEADNITDTYHNSDTIEEAPKFDVEYWKSHNLTFTNELKEVILEIVEGNDNGTELARYILEHAQNLKKMVIRHSPQHPNIADMVRESKMISRTATVILEGPFPGKRR